MAAPPFIVPAKVMRSLEAQVAATHISDPAAKDAHSDAREFLNMLKASMPPGGGGVSSFVSHVTPEGDVMGLTENMSATFLSSGNACLDFFFQVVPKTDTTHMLWLLERAWAENALMALKLIFHLRGVRGTGKSDKEQFYGAAVWLHQRHPATLLENLETVAEFGYFKDLLEVLLRLLEDEDDRASKEQAKWTRDERIKDGKRKSEKWEASKRSAAMKKQMLAEMRKSTSQTTSAGETNSDSSSDDEDGFVVVTKARKKMPKGSGYYSRKGAKARQAREAGTLRPREERVAESQAADQAAKEKARTERDEERLELATRVTRKFTVDRNFQALYLKVAAIFAHRLKEDVKALEEKRLDQISLAAKWAPTLDSSYDLRTLLCYPIATQIFPKEAHAEYVALDDTEYAKFVRGRFRKVVLAPLRKVLELPEVEMSARRWGEVNYRRVASVAMKKYTPHFEKHDAERFKGFLGDVKSGKEKIAAGALYPHEIVKSAVHGEGEVAEVAELQWARMVEDLKAKGKLSNCIAVCDVSGSMTGEPMEVCIALGMLLSDLSEEPWKGHVITFSSNPEIHQIQGASLKERHSFTGRMDWGMNTNLQRVFDNILTMARLHKLKPEKMIKRLFIFSDMEFDQASSTPWETDHQAVCRKFKDAGYGSPPQIVFWNLRSTSSIPVQKSKEGVALVSGFSKNLLKVFLERDGDINPMLVMELALKGDEYSKLKVVD